LFKKCQLESTNYIKERVLIIKVHLVNVMKMFLTGNLDIFPQYQWNDPDTENYYETYYDVTDKNKKVLT